MVSCDPKAANKLARRNAKDGGSTPPSSTMKDNSVLLYNEEEKCFRLFPNNQEEGFELSILKEGPPLFIADDRAHEVRFLFGICPDQKTRTLLYEWIEGRCFAMIQDALIDHNWTRCGWIIDVLTEADFSEKVSLRKRRS